jgi:hypothetical protein
MTSERRVRANRANSRASTGPKTALARARVARNALRHGSNLPIHSDPVWSEEVEALTREIAGTDADVDVINSSLKRLAIRIMNQKQCSATNWRRYSPHMRQCRTDEVTELDARRAAQVRTDPV